MSDAERVIQESWRWILLQIYPFDRRCRPSSFQFQLLSTHCLHNQSRTAFASCYEFRIIVRTGAVIAISLNGSRLCWPVFEIGVAKFYIIGSLYYVLKYLIIQAILGLETHDLYSPVIITSLFSRSVSNRHWRKAWMTKKWVGSLWLILEMWIFI